MNKRVIAKFSRLNSFILSFVVFGLGAGIFYAPAMSGLHLIEYLSSGVWTWLWPIAAVSAALLMPMIVLLLWVVVINRSEALYIDSDGRLVFMLPFILRVAVADISFAEYVERMSLFGRGGFIRLHLDKSHFKSFKVDLLEESGDVVAQELNNILDINKFN